MKNKMFILLLVMFVLSSSFVYADHDRDHNGTSIERVLYVEEVGRTRDPTFYVGGTEYSPLDEGKIFVQLDINGVAQTNATCFTDAWFPNSTEFFQDQFMVHLDDGIYFHDFIVSNQTGVYPVGVRCTFETETTNFFPESLLIAEGDQQSGAVTDMYIIDGNSLIVTETVGSGRIMDFNVSFVDVEENATIDMFVLDVFFRRLRTGNDPLGDFLNLFIFNFTSNEFLPIITGTDYTVGFIRRMQEINLGNFSDVIENGTVIIRVNDTLSSGDGDNRDTETELDFMRLIVVETLQNTTVDNIRGGGEIHVTATGGAVEIKFSLVDFLFLVLFFFVTVCVFARNPFLWAMCGFFTIIFGFVLIINVAFWVGVIFLMVGLMTLWGAYLTVLEDTDKNRKT